LGCTPLDGVRLHNLYGHDGSVFARCARDNERVRHLAAAQQFLLLDILLKARDRIDFGYERAFLGGGRRE
jgi:hypothetical protein